MAKTWDFEIRQTGKAALAKIAKNEEVDTIDLKYALRELNEQYTEPPLHGSSLGGAPVHLERLDSQLWRFRLWRT